MVLLHMEPLGFKNPRLHWKEWLNIWPFKLIACRKRTLGAILLWEQICACLSPAASVFVNSTNVDSWGDYLVMKSNLHNVELFIVSRQLWVVCACFMIHKAFYESLLNSFLAPRLHYSFTHTRTWASSTELIHSKQNPPILIQPRKCIMSLF